MMKYYHGKRLKPSEDDATEGSLGILLVFTCFCVESNSLFVSTNLANKADSDCVNGQ